MSSDSKIKFTTAVSSKGAGATVTSNTVTMPNHSENHILNVKADSSCSGTVDVELEMSPDGTNWCPAVTKKIESGTSSTGDIIGNEKNVKLTPDAGENKNKHGRGLMSKNLASDAAYSGSEGTEANRTDGADFMYHRIQTTKSFNYSQWIKSSTAPSATYKPVLFRHAGYDNFSNAKTVELGTGTGYTNSSYLKGAAIHELGGLYKETSGGLMSEGTTHNNYGTDPVTINFWAYIPSTIGAAEATLVGDSASVSSGRFIYVNSSKQLILYSNSVLNYRYAGFTLEDQYLDQWIMITVVLDSDTITNAKFYIQNSTTTNTTAITNTITSGQTITTYPDNGSTINHSGFLGCRTYNNAKYPASASVSSTEFKIDEYTAWGKALSSSEITALHNNHKVFDYSTHSANSDLFRYIRFGDLTGDSNSTINCKIDSNFDLAKDSGASGTYVNSLTGVDDVFTAPNNQNLSNARGATAENGGAVESITSGNAWEGTGGIIQDDDNYDLTTNAWSIGFWFKSNVNVGSGGTPNFGTGYNNATLGRAMFLTTHTASSNFNGGLFFQIFSGTSVSAGWNIDGSVGVFDRLHKTTALQSANQSDTGGNWMDGNWHHVMIVKASASAPNLASTTGLTYYLDGVQIYKTKGNFGSGAGNIANIVDKTAIGYGSLCTKLADGSDANIQTGPMRNTASFTNVGKMDNICFWKSDQSSNASTIYNSGKPLTTNPGSPTTYLRMEDSSNLDLNSVTGSAVSTDKSAYTTLRVQQEVLTTSDSIYVGGVPTLNTHFDKDTNLSISGWFKTTDTGVLFSNTDGAAADGMKLEVNATNVVLTLIDSSQTVTAASDVNDGNWHHILVVKPSGATPTIKIYVDGVEKVSTTVSTITNDDLKGANGFTLLGDGQQNFNNSPSETDASKLNATLSNWSIHTEALNANAALQLYSNGNVRNIKNLPDVTAASIKAWWQLADTSNPQNDLISTNHLQFIDGESMSKNLKGIQASTSTTSGSKDYIANAASLFGGKTLPAYNGAWSLSFWVNIPSNGTSFDSIITQYDGGETQKHFKVFQLSGNLTFSLAYDENVIDMSVPFTTYNTWKHVVMSKAAGEPGTGNFSVYIDGVSQTVSATYNDNTPARGSTDNWNSTNGSGIRLFAHSWSYTTNGSNAGSRTGRVFKLDELAGYSKELSEAEAQAIYNSGNFINLKTLASSYNLESYYRFGDAVNDVSSGTVCIRDQVDLQGQFKVGDSSDQAIFDLASSDPHYKTLAVSNLVPRLVNATDATLIADGINGHGMTMSITKSFNFTTKKWVSTTDQDAAICLSFNGFEDQAEYFALWKCSQTLAGSAVNVLDGNYHNIILSYRGRNDFSSDNVDPGDVVKFGPGDSTQAYNWTLSIDGVETTTINNGSGVDYIGGLNTLSTATYGGTSYNVGFAIQDRHLKHTIANTEEVYKPHAQFSSSILDSGGADNVHAFQGVVDETSFHSDCWWVNEAGTSIVANNFNGEKPATIYGNTTALSNRGDGKEYPVGKPYPLRNPEKLVTTGAASDIEGTNQYINPNPYDASSNPKGGLEAFWRWGDTPGDCSVTINDAKSHADGNNNNDLSAENLTTADVITLTSADSTYLASSTASSGGTTTSFPQVKISAIQASVCNIKQMESQILKYLRVKFTGAGSCNLGESSVQAQINFEIKD